VTGDLNGDYLQLLKLALTGLTEAEPMKVQIGQDRSRASMAVVPASLEERWVGADWPAHGLTMVGMKRLDNVQACVESVLVDGVPGDLVETGIWRGGTSMLMRAVLKVHGATDRLVFAADSFEGLPPPDADEFPVDDGCHLHEWDYLSVPLEAVQANFERYGLLDDQVRFVKGWFRDTMPGLSGRTWAVIRMDGDMYESTMTVLENLYPGLSPGGYLIVDDYKIKRCRAAIDDFRSRHGITDEIKPIDWMGAYWRKSGGDG
jgi:hypothetical protein